MDRRVQRQGSSSKLTGGRYQQSKGTQLLRQNSGSQLKTTPLQQQSSNSHLRATASGVGIVFGFKIVCMMYFYNPAFWKYNNFFGAIDFSYIIKDIYLERIDEVVDLGGKEFQRSY